MSKQLCYAACSFGLEAVVARQLEQLGLEEVRARDARVYFCADEEGIARANLWLSAADRVYLVLSEFSAATFEELFQGVKAITWADYLPKTALFPVLADSVRSTLKSVPDIQSVSKKAVVEALKGAYGVSFFRESGAQYQIYVSILADKVSVCLNTSGQGLNRRGYRVKNGPAPLRETLAAGIISLSRWRDRPFYDLTCGSGTIAIEAALQARNRAPGFFRQFDAEAWSEAYQKAFRRQQEQAEAAVKKEVQAQIFASDLNPKMVEMAEFHAKRAGVADLIRFSVADARDFAPKTPEGTVFSNPPYAIRMGEKKQVRELYRDMGTRLRELAHFKSYFICADEQFESAYGKQADKKRKLYNGNIKCTFYQYFRSE